MSLCLPLATQNLIASVLGSDDQNVIWQIQGSGCSLSGACGSIDSVCLFSSAGFDTSMSYIVSGPGDLTVISKQPAGLNIIHLTLQIPARAAAGSRTLFIQNANLDRTAATGVLEVR